MLSDQDDGVVWAHLLGVTESRLLHEQSKGM